MVPIPSPVLPRSRFKGSAALPARTDRGAGPAWSPSQPGCPELPVGSRRNIGGYRHLIARRGARLRRLEDRWVPKKWVPKRWSSSDTARPSGRRRVATPGAPTSPSTMKAARRRRRSRIAWSSGTSRSCSRAHSSARERRARSPDSPTAAQIEPDLVEWDYGDYEGLTTPQIRETRPGWTVFDGGVVNGETADEVGVRADRVIARLEAVDGAVALFSHAHMLRILAARSARPARGRRPAPRPRPGDALGARLRARLPGHPALERLTGTHERAGSLQISRPDPGGRGCCAASGVWHAFPSSEGREHVVSEGRGPRAGVRTEVADARRRPRAPGVWPVITVFALASAVLLAGCGGGDSDPRVIDAGQVDIKLPQGYKVVAGKVVAPPTSVAATAPTTAARDGRERAAGSGSRDRSDRHDRDHDPARRQDRPDDGPLRRLRQVPQVPR